MWPPQLGRGARPVTVHLAVLAAYLAAGIAVNWTRATYLVDHVVPTGRDSGLFVWDYWWMARLVLHPSNPWFTHYLAAPVGAPLGFHVLMPLPGVLMAPVTLAYGPSFSYNLLAVAAPGLMCYAMYRAARLWVPSQTGAIAAGAFFGLSTMMTWNAWYEIQLALGAIFLPLSLEAAVRLTRRPGWRQAAILGVVLGTALLVDQESTILAWSLAAAVLLLWLVRRPAHDGIAAWVKLRVVALAGLVTVVVASPQIIAMVQQTIAGQATVSQGALAEDYRNSGAALERIFAPSPRVSFFGLKSLASIYYHAAPTSFTFTAYGVVLTALGLLGLVVGWRRRNVRLLGLLWLAGTSLALGTGIVIRQPPICANRPGMAWRPGVGHHAVHLDSADLVALLVPGGRPVHRDRAGRRRPARRGQRELAALSRPASPGRGGRAGHPRSRQCRRPALPGHHPHGPARPRPPDRG